MLAVSAATALGGTDERWLRAAGELTMPVLAPTLDASSQRASYTFALYWRERGIQIALLSRGTPRGQLLQLARSMVPVGQ